MTSFVVSELPRAQDLQFLSEVEGNALFGRFTLLSTRFNNRPVYFNLQLQLFLYFYRNRDLNLWIVGPTLGSRTGVRYVYDVAGDPCSISSTWTVVIEDITVVDSSLRVECEYA